MIYKIYVHSDRRGHGFGPRLVDALAAALFPDADTLHLEHFAANERAGVFYERVGFTVRRLTRTAPATPASSSWGAPAPLPESGRAGRSAAAHCAIPVISLLQGCPKHESHAEVTMVTSLTLRIDPASLNRDGGPAGAALLREVETLVRETGLPVAATQGGGPATKGVALDAAVGGYLILQWLEADPRVTQLAEKLAEWLKQRPEVVVTLSDGDENLTIHGGSARRQARLIREWCERRGTDES